MKVLQNIGIFAFIALLFPSCGGDFNGLSVEEYIAENNLTTTELAEGVHILFTQEGNGVQPPNVDTRVFVNYKGYLTDGTVFDANDDIDFLLRSVIRGWQIGIRAMSVGSSATLIIPPAAGYGSAGQGDIPGNAVLIFEVDLLDFE